jgi:DNA repair photolyase
MAMGPLPIHGRGTSTNPVNRFERIELEPDPEAIDSEDEGPRTEYYRDASRTIIAHNDSPDVGFDVSINPYRGCEHGCVYCYARPTHEWIGMSAGLDFETKILVKEDAPQLLRAELSSPKWEPQVLNISGVTDAYQPIERRLKLTRGCLEVLTEFRNPFTIITKNELVTRDIDLMKQMSEVNGVAVFLSITSLDSKLAGVLEPRASRPPRRLAAVEALAKAGIPVGAMMAPIIPGLTDHELPSIVAAAANAGARFAGYLPVRLPYGVSELFQRWLDEHAPDRKSKVLSRIRSIRGGRLNDPEFGSRMVGQGVFAEQLETMFRIACRRAGINERELDLSTAAFRRPAGPQLSLFG